MALAERIMEGEGIEEYLRKDPSVVTRYLREVKRLESGIKKVNESLKRKVNKHVDPKGVESQYSKPDPKAFNLYNESDAFLLPLIINF
jgi:hypothetical protein